MKIGKKIKELRKQRGWTQAELADKLFISDKAVSKWEQGLGNPELSMLVDIARLFDISLSELVSNDDTYKPTIEEKQEAYKRRRMRAYCTCVAIVAKSNDIDRILNEAFDNYSKNKDKNIFKCLDLGLVMIAIKDLETIYDNAFKTPTPFRTSFSGEVLLINISKYLGHKLLLITKIKNELDKLVDLDGTTSQKEQKQAYDIVKKMSEYNKLIPLYYEEDLDTTYYHLDDEIFEEWLKKGRLDKETIKLYTTNIPSFNELSKFITEGMIKYIAKDFSLWLKKQIIHKRPCDELLEFLDQKGINIVDRLHSADDETVNKFKTMYNKCLKELKD